MAKTKIVTAADELRAIKRSQADDLAELLGGDLSMLKHGCEIVGESLSSINMDEFETLADALEQVPATRSFAEAITDTVAGLNMLLLEIGEAEVFESFVSAYDDLETALFDFIDLRDADTYAGIGEERAQAWEEVAASADILAEAWEQVGYEAQGVKF